jgi:hypothetical protein
MAIRLKDAKIANTGAFVLCDCFVGKTRLGAGRDGGAEATGWCSSCPIIGVVPFYHPGISGIFSYDYRIVLATLRHHAPLQEVPMNVKPALSFTFGAFLLASVQFASAETSSLSNPAQFLAQFPSGAGLAAQVRNLLASDKSTLSQLIGLLGSANGDQQNAIADGLAQAAKFYIRTDPACAPSAPSTPVCFGTQIQQAVANTNDPNFIKAYASIAGDTGTASTGGGGGAGGGQTGNIATGGSSTGGITQGQTFSPNTFTNLLTSSGAGGASFSSVSSQ